MSTSDHIGPEEYQLLPDPPLLESAMIGSSRETALHEAVKMWGYHAGNGGHLHSEGASIRYILNIADEFLKWLEE